MKKFLVGLAACLALGSAALAAGPAAPPESTAYIVSLADSWQTRVHSFSDGALTELAASQGLYLADSADTVDALRRSGALLYAEPDCSVRLLGEVNDALYSEQWNLLEMHAPALWDAGLGGDGVRVAVIDSGLYAEHEDLAGADILSGVNFLNGSDDLTDLAGHGTFVTGVIAAVRNNGVGIAGIADGVTIVPMKCFEDKDETNVSYIINAIYKAVDSYDCDVINLSLGLGKDMQSFRQAVDYAAAQGVIIVSSVGNYGGEALMYPAAYDNVVGVGAVDKTGTVCSFSQYNESVFVTAPGTELCSLGTQGPDIYMTGSGTSFATPHVTALAAIAKGVDPDMDVSDFQALLAGSAVDRGETGYDTRYGYGTLDAAAFARYLTQAAPAEGVYFRAGAQAGETLDYDLRPLFTSSTGAALTYTVAADNAAGALEIRGGHLYFTPAAADACKHVRIVLTASDGLFPSHPVYLTVSVSDASAPGDTAFADLTGHWSALSTARAVEAGLFAGVTETRFAPDDGMTRGMLVTVLARLAGADATPGETGFSDVPPEKWYAPYVAWAAGQGLVTGVGDGLFQPERDVTRQELVVILCRFAQSLGLATDAAPAALLDSYRDLDAAAGWAAQAISWAVGQGILSGETDAALSPTRSITRAEAAALLLRFTASL